MLRNISLPLLGCHQEFLLDTLRMGTFGHEGELEVSDDLINDFVILDKGDHFHLSPALRAEERIHFIDFFYHLGPAFGGHMSVCIINDWHMKGIGSSPAHLSSVGVGV
jgi:hypothetical protein